jgi:hypothetical protein
MMTETPEDFRKRVEQVDNKFYEDADKRAKPHRERAFEYEKLTVEFTQKVFQTLTYLNGGALVAIPTAMAFFKADVGRTDVLVTAGAFVTGLLCVVGAQISAFCTMSRRSEAQQCAAAEQVNRVAALGHQHKTPGYIERLSAAEVDRTTANRLIRRSNVWRRLGLFFFISSTLVFITGCVVGGKAILVAKEKPKITSSAAK